MSTLSRLARCRIRIRANTADKRIAAGAPRAQAVAVTKEHGDKRNIDGRRRLLLIGIGFLLIPAASGHHRLGKAECRRLREQIQKLQSRLRQGHSARQGRRYRERMRELELKRFRKC